MANDYILRCDAELNAWQANFVTPTRKAKPPDVMGAEIWGKIGPTPPVDPSKLTFPAVDARTPYTTDFDYTNGGKQAHYTLLWLNHSRRNRPVEQSGNDLCVRRRHTITIA